MSKRKPFVPTHHPNAGRRKAKDRAAADREAARGADDKLAARERYERDKQRALMMAKIEPERYLRLSGEASMPVIGPGGESLRKIARAVIERRAARRR